MSARPVLADGEAVAAAAAGAAAAAARWWRIAMPWLGLSPARSAASEEIGISDGLKAVPFEKSDLTFIVRSSEDWHVPHRRDRKSVY